jgi:large subunit ribosomal protein L13
VRTYTTKPEDIKREWFVIDATGMTLGRLSTQIATVLKGKHKPIYSPHMDTGDFVVVVNAHKVRVTGRKLDQKIYYRHSGYPGGLKEISLRDQLDRHPDRVIRFGGARHAAQESPGPPDDQEAQDIRHARPSARSAAAPADDDLMPAGSLRRSVSDRSRPLL